MSWLTTIQILKQILKQFKRDFLYIKLQLYACGLANVGIWFTVLEGTNKVLILSFIWTFKKKELSILMSSF